MNCIRHTYFRQKPFIWLGIPSDAKAENDAIDFIDFAMVRLKAEFQDDLINDDDINSTWQIWNRFLPRHYCIRCVLGIHDLPT